MKQQPHRVLSVAVPSETAELLRQVAIREDRSLSAVIRSAIRERLARERDRRP